MQRSLLQVQVPWRRAGAKSVTVVRLAVMSVVAALLLAATAIPVIGAVGVAARDVANTFNTLPVGKLGLAPARSTIYAANGRVITYLYPNHIFRVPVPYDQIAPVMRDAIVAIEDSSFFQQGALDPRGTLRALLHNTGGSGLQGASTLAQQYVKNVRVLQATDATEVHAATYPNLQRKVQQLRLAAAVEHEMSPDDLLAAYLNVTPFDNNAYGIQVAAEVYFSKPASQLTLPEAALLAGLVQAPTTYDPVSKPANALVRRSEVLTRMWQLHYVSKAVALAAEKSPLGLHMSPAPLNTGCASPQAAGEAFFCSYVQYVLEVNYPSIWKEINVTGGLAVYTTLNMQDQRAANNAVDYVQAPRNSTLNPGHNADTEVLLQPGTGFVKAIAVNRTYGNGPGQDSYDYAVNSQYGGDINGVQTGSSSKIFTLITALKDNYPFGHAIKIKNPDTVGPFTNCHGVSVAPFTFNNSEKPFKGSEIWQMGLATVDSINTYFANLEQQVGLCSVVRTAVDMGMTRADGTSLLKYDPKLGYPNGLSADNISSFTLGAVGVSPMSMAAAYASVAARGWYCSPQAITNIEVIASHQQLPVQKASCHRDMSQGVADAANYLLQRVLTTPGATAAGRIIPGHTAAAKTGTANAGYFAAFAGYTPTLAGYVSVFNPVNPIKYPMTFQNSCYRDLLQFGGFQCPGQMFGDNAPGATWEETFLHAQLGADVQFVYPPGNFFTLGSGFVAEQPVGGKKKPKKPGGGPGGGPGPGPSPLPSPPIRPAH